VPVTSLDPPVPTPYFEAELIEELITFGFVVNPK